MTIINRILGSAKDYRLQYRALHLLLFSGVLLGFLASTVNLLTHMNFVNVLLPIIAAMFCLILYYYSKKGKHPYVAKISFIIFIDFIYFPLGWMTSAGSLSSMPYYSILFLVVTFLIIEYKGEYVIPVLFLILALFLMYSEIRWPNLIPRYASSSVRFVEIAIHYSIVALFLGTIFAILFSKYMDVSHGYNRQNVYDELTGLYNRTYGIKQLQMAYENHFQFDTKYTLILLELDHFKSFNMVYGSLVGDELLKSLAKIMQNGSRSNDLCCRYGGDEFLILLNHTDFRQVDTFLARLSTSFDQLVHNFEKNDLLLLVGKAHFEYNDINELMKAAELDLSNNKAQIKKGQ